MTSDKRMAGEVIIARRPPKLPYRIIAPNVSSSKHTSHIGRCTPKGDPIPLPSLFPGANLDALSNERVHGLAQQQLAFQSKHCTFAPLSGLVLVRSEERRVGKGCRS